MKKKPQNLKGMTFDVDVELKEAFDHFCDCRGIVQRKAAAAAIRLFLGLSPELREILIRGDFEQVRAWFEIADAASSQYRAKAALQRVLEGPREVLGGPSRKKNETG